MPTGTRLIIGAIAGIAGAAAMHLFRVGWERLYPCNEDGIFGFDWEADVRSVNLVSPHSDAEAERIAMLLHYAFGTASGAAYALAAEKFPPIAAGQGTVFGLALWLIADELLISASGVSHPRKKNPKSHLSAAAVHVLFGAIVNAGSSYANH